MCHRHPATLDTWIRNATRATTIAEALVPDAPLPPVEPQVVPRARKPAAGKAPGGGQRRKRAPSPA